MPAEPKPNSKSQTPAPALTSQISRPYSKTLVHLTQASDSPSPLAHTSHAYLFLQTSLHITLSLISNFPSLVQQGCKAESIFPRVWEEHQQRTVHSGSCFLPLSSSLSFSISPMCLPGNRSMPEPPRSLSNPSLCRVLNGATRVSFLLGGVCGSEGNSFRPGSWQGWEGVGCGGTQKWAWG